MKYTINADPFRRRSKKFAGVLFPLIVQTLCSTQTFARITRDSMLRKTWGLCFSVERKILKIHSWIYVINHIMNVFYLIAIEYVTQRFPCGEKDIALKQSHKHIGRKCLDRLQSHRSWIFFHELLFSSANHHSMPEIELKSIVTRFEDLKGFYCYLCRRVFELLTIWWWQMEM